jgi:hypothetical protein
MSNSNLFLSIGKPIKNEYGRIIGKVASFALTPTANLMQYTSNLVMDNSQNSPWKAYDLMALKSHFISKIKNSSRHTL